MFDIIYLIFITTILKLCSSHMITPGIMTDSIKISPQIEELAGFPQPALNNTQVQVAFACSAESKMSFIAQIVIRSSPCDREFFNVGKTDRIKDLLTFYFGNDSHIPPSYNYDSFLYYISKPQTFHCIDSHGSKQVMEEIEPVDFKTIIVNHTRPKREAFKAANSFRDSLTTYHPLKTLPEDAIYLLLIKITPVSEVTEGESLQLVINWKGPRGYLNAIDEPLLRFYGLMVALYSVLLLGWLYLCARKWKDLLKIQYWIGAVILVGLIEKAVFYTEYMVANDTGITTIGMIEFAELISSIKKTMARVLIIIVSLGYGVVKPRLGETFNQVGVVGGLYLVFSVIEGVMRTSWKPAEGIKERQFATIPLIFFEVAIFWWVFSSLSATIRALSIRGNDIKRNLYMKFANILGLSVISSVIFLVWYLWNHVFQHCLTDWKELWFDVAFWHLLFCSVLISIMFLWRPAVNNQRFAFTPLLDDSEDDADDTFAVNTSCIDEIVTKRTNTSLNTKTLSVRKSDVDDSIERDMKWIEDNIPTTFVERFLLDDEEDEDAKRLEISKIL